MSAVTISSAGTYSVIVSNSAGQVTSVGAPLVVVPRAPGAPTIVTQPQAQTVTTGTNVTFSVGAGGTGPFGYQWRKDGLALPGATTSTLALAAVQAADAGTYSVVVSNAGGSVLSADALLTVNPPAPTPPSFTSQPQSQTANQNSPVTFTVGVAGTAPFTYQWRRDAVDLPGATNATYTIASAQPIHAGTYTVRVANSVGWAISAGALLTVVGPPPGDPPTITGQPVPLVVNPGAGAQFSVMATGTSPLTYQWRKNDVDIPGANGPTYAIPAVTEADEGLYRVLVQNAIGSRLSQSAGLSVNDPVVILAQPMDLVVAPAGTATFSVTASGTAPLSFQWMKDGTALPGAVGATFALSSVSSIDVGVYAVRVGNVVGFQTSRAASLILATPVDATITTNPQTTSGVKELVAEVPSNPGATYAWTLLGGEITAGQGTRSLRFTAGAAGWMELTCEVAGPGGTARGTARVEVFPAPVANLLTLPEGLPNQGNVWASVPAQAGMNYAWTWGSDPAGATFEGPTDGPLVRFHLPIQPGLLRIRVTVSNAIGFAVVRERVIPVVSRKAVRLPGQAVPHIEPQGMVQDRFGRIFALGDGGDGANSRNLDIWDPQAKAWMPGPRPEWERIKPSMAINARGQILVAGGRGGGIRKLELFDPETWAWTSLPDSSVDRSSCRVVTLADGRFLVLGGINQSAVERVEPDLRTVVRVADLNKVRGAPATLLLPGGRVLVVGGGYGYDLAVISEIYDPLLDRWTMTGSLAAYRIDGVLVDWMGSPLLVGGRVDPQFGASATTPVVERLDLEQGVWLPFPALNVGRYRHTVTALPDGRLVVVGGILNSEGGSDQWIEVYEPTAGAWRKALALPSPLLGHGAFVQPDGTLWFGLGTNDKTIPSAGQHCHWGALDVDTLQVSAWGPSLPPLYSGSEPVGGERVLRVNPAHLSMDLYTSRRATWIVEPNTTRTFQLPLRNQARKTPSGTLLPDGRVWIVGGRIMDPVTQGSSATQGSTEIWDPATGLWSAGPSLADPRDEAKIVEMPGRGCLVAGGSRTTASLPGDLIRVDPVPSVELVSMELPGATRLLGSLPGAPQRPWPLNGDRFFIQSTGGGSVALFIYDFATQVWTQLPGFAQMPNNERILTLVTTVGELWAFGDNGACERFDFERGAWFTQPARTIKDRRHNGTCMALPGGRILVRGQQSDPWARNDNPPLEIWERSTSNWAVLDPPAFDGWYFAPLYPITLSDWMWFGDSQGTLFPSDHIEGFAWSP